MQDVLDGPVSKQITPEAMLFATTRLGLANCALDMERAMTVLEENMELKNAAKDVNEESEEYSHGSKEQMPRKPVSQVVHAHSRHSLPQFSLPFHHDLTDLNDERKHRSCVDTGI